MSQQVLTLLDEPVAGLNSEETGEIAALIRQMRLYGKTMVLVEHDMDLVMSLSDHVVVLDSGNRIAAGPPDEIRVNPLVLEAYLALTNSVMDCGMAVTLVPAIPPASRPNRITGLRRIVPFLNAAFPLSPW